MVWHRAFAQSEERPRGELVNGRYDIWVGGYPEVIGYRLPLVGMYRLYVIQYTDIRSWWLRKRKKKKAGRNGGIIRVQSVDGNYCEWVCTFSFFLFFFFTDNNSYMLAVML